MVIVFLLFYNSIVATIVAVRSRDAPRVAPYNRNLHRLSLLYVHYERSNPGRVVFTGLSNLQGV